MSVPDSILADWDGESFVPAGPVWAKRADDKFVVGERYSIEIREARSIASHRQYFATINEAWMNLPDALAERFPSADHLRKYALIKAGFRDERSIVCASKAEAARIAAFIRPIDDFAIVIAQDATVTAYTAKSQSMRAMGKADFEASKRAVLDIVSTMIGTDAETVSKNTEKAA